jgi:hypothetical protein
MEDVVDLVVSNLNQDHECHGDQEEERGEERPA